jgi:hypothetical protein
MINMNDFKDSARRFDEEFAVYWKSGEQFEDLQNKDPIPADEFVDSYKDKLLGNTRRVIKRDCFWYYSWIRGIYQHLSTTEIIEITLLSIGMTLFFCYYSEQDGDESYRLAARLDFTIIGIAVLFPSTMVASAAIERRDTALQRFAALKGNLVQLFIGYLTWRNSGLVMKSQWEIQALQIISRCAALFRSTLLLPRIRGRYQYTPKGRAFADLIFKAQQQKHAELVKLQLRLHGLVQDLKDNGLTEFESVRLFQLVLDIFTEFEKLWIIKVYRTPRVARAYIRLILTTCIMFYG